MEDLTLTLTLLLLAAAFMAGFVDSIAGGGGLIAVPALLLAGLSPVEALGTNKLQGLFGSASATVAYARKGHVDLKTQLAPAALSALGAALGALLATVIPGDVFPRLPALPAGRHRALFRAQAEHGRHRPRPPAVGHSCSG
jgi:uncharacterized membrane protein YfcA